MSFAQIAVAFIALIALVAFIEGEYWYFWDKGALDFERARPYNWFAKI